MMSEAIGGRVHWRDAVDTVGEATGRLKCLAAHGRESALEGLQAAEAAMDEETVADAMGWFSVGVGALEVLAADSITDFLGMEGREGVFRLFGLREIAAGVGLLTQERREPWMWGRVGGDVLDLAALGLGLSSDNPKRGRVATSMGLIALITGLDAWCAWRLGQRSA